MSSDPLRNGAIFRLKRTDLGAIRSPGALAGQLARQSPAADVVSGAKASAQDNGDGPHGAAKAASITAEDIIKEKFDQIYRATPVPSSLLGTGLFGGGGPLGSAPTNVHGSPSLAPGPYAGAYSPKASATPSPAGIPLAHLQQLQQQQLMHQQQLDLIHMRQNYQNISGLNQRSSGASSPRHHSPYRIDNYNNSSSSSSNNGGSVMAPPPPVISGDSYSAPHWEAASASPGTAARRARSRAARTRIGMSDSLLTLNGAKTSSPGGQRGGRSSSSGKSSSSRVQPSREEEEEEVDSVASDDWSPRGQGGRARPTQKKAKKRKAPPLKRKSPLRFVDRESDLEEGSGIADSADEGVGEEERRGAAPKGVTSTRSGRASVPTHRLIESSVEGSGVKRGGKLLGAEARKGRPEESVAAAAAPGRRGEMTLLYRVHSMTDPFAPDFWEQVSRGMTQQGGASLSADGCQKMWFNSLEEARARQQKLAEKKGLPAAVGSAPLEVAAATGYGNGKRAIQKQLAEAAVVADREDDIFDYNSNIAQLIAAGGEGAGEGAGDERAALLHFDDMASPASVHSEANGSSATSAIDAVTGQGNGGNGGAAAWKLSYIQNLSKKIGAPQSSIADKPTARPILQRVREEGVTAALDARGGVRVDVRAGDGDSD